MIHAIEILRRGKRQLYVLQAVNGNVTAPVNGLHYRTIEAAQAAAKALGITIERTGTHYEVIGK